MLRFDVLFSNIKYLLKKKIFLFVAFKLNKSALYK